MTEPLSTESTASGHVVNDVHSGLNETHVRDVVRPESVQSLREVILSADSEGRAASVAGARHAMGGQQFANNVTLIDMMYLDRVLSFDGERGLITVQAGIQWNGLVDWMVRSQRTSRQAWGIRQKQTGADALTVGGALAANAHGRGLQMKPIIDDVESFNIVGPDGQVIACSRSTNRELFDLAIGGYGLFGVIESVTLRLSPRRKLRRIVDELDVSGLITAFDRRIGDGALYGDFQFAINESSHMFLRHGILSCYVPVPDSTTMPEGQLALSTSDWKQLLYLTHTDKEEAYRLYRAHYLSTSGQVYWSDTHQLGTYLAGYHEELDRALGASLPGSEMIGELYVPRADLSRFMERAATALREQGANVVYGTIRLIQVDEESFLNWARQPYASVVINLHVDHSRGGVARCAEAFRSLIELAKGVGGSYFLTYHRWATKEQVKSCYPQFAEFLRMKLRYDPRELFQSNWYIHHREMFSDELTGPAL